MDKVARPARTFPGGGVRFGRNDNRLLRSASVPDLGMLVVAGRHLR
jgi:hypothetical protein